MAPERRERAREVWFNKVVVPNIEPERVDHARELFDKFRPEDKAPLKSAGSKPMTGEDLSGQIVGAAVPQAPKEPEPMTPGQRKRAVTAVQQQGVDFPSLPAAEQQGAALGAPLVAQDAFKQQQRRDAMLGSARIDPKTGKVDQEALDRQMAAMSRGEAVAFPTDVPAPQKLGKPEPAQQVETDPIAAVRKTIGAVPEQAKMRAAQAGLVFEDFAAAPARIVAAGGFDTENLSPEVKKAFRENAQQSLQKRAAVRKAVEQYEAAMPNTKQWSAAGIASAAIQSAPDTLLAVMVGTLGGPAAAGAVMFAAAGPEAYGQARLSGKSPTQALEAGVVAGAAESIGEAPALGFFIKQIKGMGKKQAGKYLSNLTQGLITEGAGEMLTEAMNIGYQTGVLGEKMTLREAVDRVLYAGVVGAAMGGGIQTGISTVKGGVDAARAVGEKTGLIKAPGQQPGEVPGPNDEGQPVDPVSTLMEQSNYRPEVVKMLHEAAKVRAFRANTKAPVVTAETMIESIDDLSDAELQKVSPQYRRLRAQNLSEKETKFLMKSRLYEKAGIKLDANGKPVEKPQEAAKPAEAQKATETPETPPAAAPEAADDGPLTAADVFGEEEEAAPPEPAAPETPSPEPAAPEAPPETAEPAPEYKEGDTVVWQNKDHDQPVEFVGLEEQPGPDGRQHARVRVDGKESFVPADELTSSKAERQAAQVDAGLPEERNAAPQRSGKTASWVVRNKETGEAVMETFDPEVAKAVNKDKYEVVAIQDHLADVNQAQKEQSDAGQVRSDEGQVPERGDVGTGGEGQGRPDLQLTAPPGPSASDQTRERGDEAPNAEPKPRGRKAKASVEPKTSQEFEQQKRKGFIRHVKNIGGVRSDEARDITGEKAMNANRRTPGLFRKSGRPLDEIAESLHEAGYITDEEYNSVDGGVQRARDLIAEAWGGQSAISNEDVDAYNELKAQERLLDDGHKIDRNDIHEIDLAGLNIEDEADVLDADLLARIADEDEVGFERAAKKYEKDDIGFMTWAKEWERERANKGTEAGGRGAAAGEEPTGEGQEGRAAGAEAAEQGRPLSSIIVERPAIVDSTGEELSVRQPADEALEDVDGQILDLERFILCLRN